MPTHQEFDERFDGFPALRFDSLVDYENWCDRLTNIGTSFKTRIVKKRKKRTQYLILLVGGAMIDDDGDDVCPHCGAVLIEFNWCKHCGDIEQLDEYKERDEIQELDFEDDACVYSGLNVNGAEY